MADTNSGDFLGTLAGPIGTVAGAAIGGGLSYLGQSSANDANMQMMHEQNEANTVAAWMNRDWQERMSNTSYQRAVADMKAAGLNPMLAYSNGGASTPSGATGYAVQAPTMQNKFSGAAQAISEALPKAAEVATKHAAVNNLIEQNNNLKANSALAIAQAKSADATTLKTIADAKRTDTETALNTARVLTESALQSRHRQETLTSSAHEAESNARRRNIELESVGKSQEAELDKTWYGTFRRILRDIIPVGNTASRFVH